MIPLKIYEDNTDITKVLIDSTEGLIGKVKDTTKNPSEHFSGNQTVAIVIFFFMRSK